MAYLNCSFYELLKPPIDEIVLVEFNTYEEMNIKGKLVEYNNAVFLNYSDATRKRSVSSWKK